MTSIARRNPNTPRAHEATWDKYTTVHRPGWTWTPPVRQRFCPFSTVGEQILLTVCGCMMLVLFVFMCGTPVG